MPGGGKVAWQVMGWPESSLPGSYRARPFGHPVRGMSKTRQGGPPDLEMACAQGPARRLLFAIHTDAFGHSLFDLPQHCLERTMSMLLPGPSTTEQPGLGKASTLARLATIG